LNGYGDGFKNEKFLMNANPKIFTTGWEDYELIDAGGGKKLERWGKIITIRPELQAYFKTELTFVEWKKMAHWEFIQGKGQTGNWKSIKEAPRSWMIEFKKVKIKLELTQFKHLGLFPEQRANWDFLLNELEPGDKFLNLFAYTGVASIIAKKLRTDVVHVDSVKNLISWAKENMEHCNLSDIRWVHEDAMKFIAREEKRGNLYRAIVMDPPAWGIGAKGEKWKLEDQIDLLVSTSANLLDENGFLIMNTYTPTVDFDFLKDLLPLYFKENQISLNELWMNTTTGKQLYYGNLVRISKTAAAQNYVL
jgi:23S rRNA (cytosine1962-C5)-methyltransferase